MAPPPRGKSVRARRAPPAKATKQPTAPLDIDAFFARLPDDRETILRGLAVLDDHDLAAAPVSRRAK